MVLLALQSTICLRLYVLRRKVFHKPSVCSSLEPSEQPLLKTHCHIAIAPHDILLCNTITERIDEELNDLAKELKKEPVTNAENFTQIRAVSLGRLKASSILVRTLLVLGGKSYYVGLLLRKSFPPSTYCRYLRDNVDNISVVEARMLGRESRQGQTPRR